LFSSIWEPIIMMVPRICREKHKRLLKYYAPYPDSNKFTSPLAVLLRDPWVFL
jgi:hypothetical protein